MATDAFGNTIPDPTTAGTSTTSAGVTTPSFNLSSVATTPKWEVDPKTQTVAGQLESVIAADSPLMQQARSRAQQAMNSRGLMNSSLAQSAADSAMYDTALKIAQPDANTYATAARDATQFGYDTAKLGLQTQAARDVADIEAQYKNLTQGSASATSVLNKMQDSLNALMANKDITDQTKRDALAADIKKNAADSLNLIGAIAGDVDLSQYISDIGL